MSCYVDTLRSYPSAGLRFTEFCHLLADEPAELHEMADRLGMPRRLFQDHPWRWHYDLPAHLRADAVRLGAHEVDLAAVGRLLRARRLAVAGPAAEPDAGAESGAGAIPVAGTDPAAGAERAAGAEPDGGAGPAAGAELGGGFA